MCSTVLKLRRTEVGQIAEEIVAKGGLLPDELMLRVVSSKLDTLRHKVCSNMIITEINKQRITDLLAQHWILDGFPRTVGQGKLLDAHLRLAALILCGRFPSLSCFSFRKQGLPLSLVVNLDVPDEVILARISDRWVHLPSGRVYNLSYNRPRVDGLDDETGEPLTKRSDDNPVRVEGTWESEIVSCLI